MRILAIDPGAKRIGLAISDPTGTIANPLGWIEHTARAADAAAIVKIAVEWGAALMVIGQSLDDEGRPTLEGRRAARLAAALRALTDIPIVFWDEAFTTQEARAARQAMGSGRRKRATPLDHLAAVVLLQSYLDSRS
jgi:putative Holliday junction resolvase